MQPTKRNFSRYCLFGNSSNVSRSRYEGLPADHAAGLARCRHSSLASGSRSGAPSDSAATGAGSFRRNRLGGAGALRNRKSEHPSGPRNSLGLAVSRNECSNLRGGWSGAAGCLVLIAGCRAMAGGHRRAGRIRTPLLLGMDVSPAEREHRAVREPPAHAARRTMPSHNRYRRSFTPAVRARNISDSALPAVCRMATMSVHDRDFTRAVAASESLSSQIGRKPGGESRNHLSAWGAPGSLRGRSGRHCCAAEAIVKPRHDGRAKPQFHSFPKSR